MRIPEFHSGSIKGKHVLSMDASMIPGLHGLISISKVPDPAKPEYPLNHKAGMKVAIGGSMCANCEYLSEDQKHCTNDYFIRWEGPDKPANSNVIPGEIDAYCSDWWEPEEHKNGR